MRPSTADDPNRQEDPNLPPNPGDQEEAVRLVKWRRLPRALGSAIRRLHVNIGHLGKGAMVRLLRESRASERAVEAARLFRCPACGSTL